MYPSRSSWLSLFGLNGGNRKVLNGSLAALLLLRILHVELGLTGPKAMSGVGYYGKLGFIGGMASYAAYLVERYLRF
jgi:hypothetical protein